MWQKKWRRKNHSILPDFQVTRITGRTRNQNTKQRVTWIRMIWILRRRRICWRQTPAWTWRSQGQPRTRTSPGNGMTLLGSCALSSWLSPCRLNRRMSVMLGIGKGVSDHVVRPNTRFCSEFVLSDRLCHLRGGVHYPEEWGLWIVRWIRSWWPCANISALSVRKEECDNDNEDSDDDNGDNNFNYPEWFIILCQVSVMMKNVIDCLTGGISYWAVGHGLCVGAVRRIIFIICEDDFFCWFWRLCWWCLPGILEQPFFRLGRFLCDGWRPSDRTCLWNLHILGPRFYPFFNLYQI